MPSILSIRCLTLGNDENLLIFLDLGPFATLPRAGGLESTAILAWVLPPGVSTRPRPRHCWVPLLDLSKFKLVWSSVPFSAALSPPRPLPPAVILPARSRRPWTMAVRVVEVSRCGKTWILQKIFLAGLAAMDDSAFASPWPGHPAQAPDLCWVPSEAGLGFTFVRTFDLWAKTPNLREGSEGTDISCSTPPYAC